MSKLISCCQKAAQFNPKESQIRWELFFKYIWAYS